MKLVQTDQIDSLQFFTNHLAAMAYLTNNELYNGLRRSWKVRDGKRVYGYIPVFTTFKQVK